MPINFPPLLFAALELIKYRLEVYSDNYGYGDFDFFNNSTGFKNEVFAVRGYQQCWEDEEEQPWNFKYKDIEVSWYMRLGKYPTTLNRTITPDEINQLLEDCLESIKLED